MNVAQVLHEQAAHRPNEAALIDVHRGRDRVFSFGQFEQATSRLGAQLASQGILAGDGILVLHPMSIELYAFLMALFRIGAVAVFLDPSAGQRHIARCCELFPLKGFFGSRKAHFLRMTVPTLRRLPFAWSSRWFPGTYQFSLERNAAQEVPIADLMDSAPALITFTSGSTGQPKAALRSHGFLLAQHRALEGSIGLRAGIVDLTTLPVFVLANLASGVTSVLPDANLRSPGKIDSAPVLRQIEQARIETVGASPALVERLVDGIEEGHAHVESVRHVFMGGAPVFPRNLRRARTAFPQAEITAVYGSTEAEPIAEISLSQFSADDFLAMEHGHGLLAGNPVQSLSLRIIRDQWGTPISTLESKGFRKLFVADGDVGEIVVSGDHVLPGYLHGLGDSETKFDVDGTRWHRTGDLGRLDQQGRLWLLGRASAAIKDERGVLYPFAIECAALQISGISRAAILSIEGRRVLAVESPAHSAVEAARESLQWAFIDEVRLLRSIPMDKRHNAKVDYVALRKILSA
ncbi:MAG: AMP-binding protein [Terracidiphilus sp.]|jgi:acyl-CoA synthetase (AMP-forming)/AMP-acid ligase II